MVFNTVKLLDKKHCKKILFLKQNAISLQKNRRDFLLLNAIRYCRYAPAFFSPTMRGYRRIFWVKKMEKLYTQQEAAALLGYTKYLSLNKLIATGKLRCYKREGRCGRKLFTREQLDEYIRRYLAHS